MTHHLKGLNWYDRARPFEELAREYDDWFEANPLFALELAALRSIKEKLPAPQLEIGVGPGRFAEALKITFGIDPATAPLKLAENRHILGIRSIGEQLPFHTDCMGTVFILFTLCFLAAPALVLQECSRILVPEGRLVIGMIPGQSEWGKMIAQKKDEDNAFYRHVQLRSITETVAMLSGNGFTVIESWSTLLQPPGESLAAELPQPGINEQAGFCVLVIKNNGEKL